MSLVKVFLVVSLEFGISVSPKTFHKCILFFPQLSNTLV